MGQPAEVAQLDEIGLECIYLGELSQSLIQGNQVIGDVCLRLYHRGLVQINAGQPSTAPDRALASGVLHQNPPHRFRRRRKEMAPTVPALRLVSDESEIGFVDQCGRLEGLPRGLMGQLLGGQEPQFLVDQRQEFVRSLRVPPFDGVQDACDITHADSGSQSRGLAIGDPLQRFRLLTRIFSQRRGEFSSVFADAITRLEDRTKGKGAWSLFRGNPGSIAIIFGHLLDNRWQMDDNLCVLAGEPRHNLVHPRVGMVMALQQGMYLRANGSFFGAKSDWLPEGPKTLQPPELLKGFQVAWA